MRVEVGAVMRQPLLPPRSEMVEAWPREPMGRVEEVGGTEMCCSHGTKGVHRRIQYEK